MAKLHKTGRFIGGRGIGENSAVLLDGDFVTVSGGFIAKAGVAEAIEGITAGSQTMAADNQTVDKVNVEYIKADDYMEFVIAADAAIVQADVGKHYSLNADQTVDVLTGAATGLEVKLVKFVDQLTSIYAIVR